MTIQKRSFNNSKVHITLDENYSPNWSYRIAIPKTPNKWKKGSTRTEDVDEAKAHAIKLYQKLELRAEENLPIFETTFETVSRRYISKLQTTSKPSYLVSMGANLKIINETFGDKNISSIKLKHIDEFLTERSIRFNYKAITRNQYRTAFRGVFDVAVEENYLSSHAKPKLKNERRKKRDSSNEQDDGLIRAYFTTEQASNLITGALEWSEGGFIPDSKRFTGLPTSPKAAENRRILFAMIMFINHTGARPGIECWSLKWKHISWHDPKTTHRQVIIPVTAR